MFLLCFRGLLDLSDMLTGNVDVPDAFPPPLRQGMSNAMRLPGKSSEPSLGSTPLSSIGASNSGESRLSCSRESFGRCSLSLRTLFGSKFIHLGNRLVLLGLNAGSPTGSKTDTYASGRSSSCWDWSELVMVLSEWYCLLSMLPPNIPISAALSSNEDRSSWFKMSLVWFCLAKLLSSVDLDPHSDPKTH